MASPANVANITKRPPIASSSTFVASPTCRACARWVHDRSPRGCAKTWNYDAVLSAEGAVLSSADLGERAG
eukprot:322045-Prymnesium_polylepis.2